VDAPAQRRMPSIGTLSYSWGLRAQATGALPFPFGVPQLPLFGGPVFCGLPTTGWTEAVLNSAEPRVSSSGQGTSGRACKQISSKAPRGTSNSKAPQPAAPSPNIEGWLRNLISTSCSGRCAGRAAC
jgi:hypothetical protein